MAISMITRGCNRWVWKMSGCLRSKHLSRTRYHNVNCTMCVSVLACVWAVFGSFTLMIHTLSHTCVCVCFIRWCIREKERKKERQNDRFKVTAAARLGLLWTARSPLVIGLVICIVDFHSVPLCYGSILEKKSKCKQTKMIKPTILAAISRAGCCCVS